MISKWKQTNESSEIKMKNENTKLLGGREMKSKKDESERKWIEKETKVKLTNLKNWVKQTKTSSKSKEQKVLN